jgi:hypothetical protein
LAEAYNRQTLKSSPTYKRTTKRAGKYNRKVQSTEVVSDLLKRSANSSKSKLLSIQRDRINSSNPGKPYLVQQMRCQWSPKWSNARLTSQSACA